MDKRPDVSLPYNEIIDIYSQADDNELAAQFADVLIKEGIFADADKSDLIVGLVCAAANYRCGLEISPILKVQKELIKNQDDLVELQVPIRTGAATANKNAYTMEYLSTLSDAEFNKLSEQTLEAVKRKRPKLKKFGDILKLPPKIRPRNHGQWRLILVLGIVWEYFGKHLGRAWGKGAKGKYAGSPFQRFVNGWLNIIDPGERISDQVFKDAIESWKDAGYLSSSGRARKKIQARSSGDPSSGDPLPLDSLLARAKILFPHYKTD